ncbi:MAG TPA: OmpA family protein [Tepidisphaeraceae bacterium]|jgi:flagellar motor protein MotB|nr:OmpA family protein [Tepidisphaeraceae bacterium]
MSKSCHCKKAHECEECPEWIFTFADLVMLMMGFFVILWVLKPPAGKSGASDAEPAKAQQDWDYTVGKIREGFGYEPNAQSSDPVDKALIQRDRGRKEGAENEHPRESAVGTNHDSTTVRPGKHSVVGGRLAFDPGSQQLLPESKRLLDEIAAKLRGHNAIVLVKGHASLDDFPAETPAAVKMDISLRRAQAAADYLMAHGVSPAVLRVEGCSTFEPIHQRAYDESAQSDNRRVEIEWTSELVEERQDPTDVPIKIPPEKTEEPDKEKAAE